MHTGGRIFLNIVLNSECQCLGIISDVMKINLMFMISFWRNPQFKIVREDITVDGVIMDVIKKKDFYNLPTDILGEIAKIQFRK